MIQLQMIEKVRDIALSDEAISSILMYGSFTKGEGDQYSDIEFYIYHKTEEYPDKLSFVSQIAPVMLFFTNEFGTDVAIFDNLIRGEFHFHPIANMEEIRSWAEMISFEFKDKMNLVDKDGILTAILDSIPPVKPQQNTPENKDFLTQNLLNNLIFANNLILRGEYAHAHQLFVFIQRYLLWLMRLHLSAENHWEAPTKKLEEDIPYEWYRKYEQCIPTLNKDSLQNSLMSAVALSDELFRELEISRQVREVLRKLKKQ